MNKTNLTILVSIVLTLFCYNVKSQTLAITENNDTIYVYNNGTWSFELLENMPVINELDYLNIELDIDTIDTEFKYSHKAKKQIKNSSNQFVIKYDEKIWKRVPPATLNEEAEFAFESKKSDIWCIVIAEETAIEIDKLYRIAKKNMVDNSEGEVEIIKTELRTVNNTQVLRGVMKTHFSGITFIFDAYYFSNEKGSVQFTTWTSDVVWEKNEEEIVELLNGFIVE